MNSASRLRALRPAPEFRLPFLPASAFVTLIERTYFASRSWESSSGTSFRLFLQALAAIVAGGRLPAGDAGDARKSCRLRAGGVRGSATTDSWVDGGRDFDQYCASRGTRRETGDTGDESSRMYRALRRSLPVRVRGLLERYVVQPE